MHPRLGLFFSLTALFISAYATLSVMPAKPEPIVKRVLSATTIAPTPTATPIPAVSQPMSPATPTPIKKIIPIAPSGPMATPEQLFAAINAYRQSHSLAPVAGSPTLCTIAATRANQQQSLGHLDHGGFDALAKSQTEFRHVAEILQYFSVPKDATYLVNTGWAGSASHNGVILDGSLTHGCGGVAGFYSVFIFGR